MNVIHPQGVYNNQPPENVFLATDNMGTNYGCGTIIYTYQPDIFPDRPHNMFLSLDCQPAAQYLIFGALLARAHQIWHEKNPAEGARVYTSLSPSDSQQLEFYLHNGFDVTPADQMLRLECPPAEERAPLGFDYQQTPLNTFGEQSALIARLNQNGINHINQNYLAQALTMPHFLCLSLVYTGANGAPALAGEALLAGHGGSSEVLAMYIAPAFRRQGLGTSLLRHAMTILSREGVSLFTSTILSNSKPQVALARHFNPTPVGQGCIYPSMELNP